VSQDLDSDECRPSPTALPDPGFIASEVATSRLVAHGYQPACRSRLPAGLSLTATSRLVAHGYQPIAVSFQELPGCPTLPLDEDLDIRGFLPLTKLMVTENIGEAVGVSGAMGTFRTDQSREVFAISGPVTTEGARRRRRHLTFVVSSSALTSLALGEGRDATIEWEKWKGKVTTIDRALSSSVVQVDGSWVFLLGERVSREGKTGFTVHDFCPGTRKAQRSLPYTEQDVALISPPSHVWPQLWEVSGDTVVLFDVRDLDFVCTRLLFRLTPEICGFPVNNEALHPHCLVHVNLHRNLALFFCPLVAYARLGRWFILA
jgi:hypothetical protein